MIDKRVEKCLRVKSQKLKIEKKKLVFCNRAITVCNIHKRFAKKPQIKSQAFHLHKDIEWVDV